MKAFIKIFIFLIIPLGIAAVYGITGYSYVPVEYTLGKCTMDYSNTNSWSERPSPLTSLHFQVDRGQVLLCYGSPAANERKIFGDLVPYDRVWRFGANEATRLYTNADLVIGEVVVPKGRYSIYVLPHRRNWEVFISESTYHWGSDINPKVREKEIGSFEVPARYNINYVENLTMTTQNLNGKTNLIIEWEKTRVVIPIISFEGD